MANEIIDNIEGNPVIAAIRNEEDIDIAIKSEVSSVFLLKADIFNVGNYVNKIKSSGKYVFVHFEFLEGLGRDNKAIDYIAEVIKPDGIITTRSNHVKYAEERGLFTIQRFFLVDSQSYETAIKSLQNVKPDMVEIMPAVMPNVIRRFKKEITIPVIAGGLIDSKEDIIDILKAGALGVSTGKKDLWGV
ncbi:MAG TPA: glycerol-3-phosphate responsive antiterminator [Clostridiaceae bacterium]|nr:glycerol-3-phosphate responsive antiterminator [Clostridiaceae bacterium]